MEVPTFILNCEEYITQTYKCYNTQIKKYGHAHISTYNNITINTSLPLIFTNSTMSSLNVKAQNHINYISHMKISAAPPHKNPQT